LKNTKDFETGRKLLNTDRGSANSDDVKMEIVDSDEIPRPYGDNKTLK